VRNFLSPVVGIEDFSGRVAEFDGEYLHWGFCSFNLGVCGLSDYAIGRKGVLGEEQEKSFLLQNHKSEIIIHKYIISVALCSL
jgi:hypothetical protein